METRIHVNRTETAGYRGLLAVEKAISQSSIEKPLRELIKLRVSQINGCAYCIDMHWKDARADGESEQRLYGLSAWRESPYYSKRERSALLLAEELTRIADRSVSEEVYDEIRDQFSDDELADLVWVITAINAWNRISIGFGSVPGDYQPPKVLQTN